MTRPPRARAALLPATAITLVLLGAGVAGCGQKGALYLPDESPERVEPGLPADPDERTAAEDDDEEEGAAGER